jgi:predicted DNA repair protein MutK
MVAGAVRTDFILSAEIMAIALAEVAAEPLAMRAVILALVAVAITVGVYGAVGLIVKMDDIGLHLAERRAAASRAAGRALVHAMPKVMAALSAIGIAAMIWVGGGIIVHGLESFGAGGPAHLIHDVAAVAGRAVPGLDAIVEWTVGAAGAGRAGLAVGAVIVAVHHLAVHRREAALGLGYWGLGFGDWASALTP